MVVEPWIDGLWEALESILSSTSIDDSAIADVSPELSSQLRVHVHDSCYSMNASPSRDNRTIGKKLVVDGMVKTAAVNSSDSGVSELVETDDKMCATCTQDAHVQSESSARQTQSNILNRSILDQRASTVIGELATSFEDRVLLSQSSAEHCSISAEHSNNSSTTLAICANVSGSSPLNGGETRTAQNLGIEIHVAAISETGITGRGCVKEDDSVRDAFKTPSVELTGVPLVLPSVQPPFIEVILKNVSMYTCTCLYYNNIYIC